MFIDWFDFFFILFIYLFLCVTDLLKMPDIIITVKIVFHNKLHD